MISISLVLLLGAAIVWLAKRGVSRAAV